MRRSRAAVLALTAAIAVVGCASDEGKAQDSRPTKGEGGDAASRPAKDGGEPKKPERRFKAKVEDRLKTPPYVLSDAVFFQPEVSLFGGSGGTAQRELVVKRGAAEITVPFEDVAQLEIGDEKDDRIEVVVRFREPEKTGKELKGTVRANLEIRGTFEGGTLKATVKLREARVVTLEETR